ncbi:adenylate kinase isoenzyme 5-like isoform X2 [Homarus americanus]|uniref:adenylate kinase isoenzyme 5-like isoform X2 n=1 Tax=Homarus americanus TaxID=6706 RepID=UPI001C496E0A|nr:adenylate kinase isoenzyme 5-like isoform X2 [Homarus americanus]
MQVFSEISRLFKMGICLDTDRSGSPLVGEGRNGEAETTAATTPATTAPPGPTNIAPTEAITGAPVIFFLGGPGSGKMTHAQNLSDIHEGYRHINLTVVISEYIKENDLGSPQSISATIALALLAREMHLTPRSRGYLVSGYPRHMDDVHHYNEKLGRPTGAILLEWDRGTLIRNIELRMREYYLSQSCRLRSANRVLGNIDGAILLDWRESTLLNNLEAGARMGTLMLDAARKELSEFHSKVLPVCEYFDNQGLLYVVSGERSQEEVFRDVQRAHAKIMRPPPLPPPSRASIGSYREYRSMATSKQNQPLSTSAINVNSEDATYPPCLFFMGGPGSDKWRLMSGITYLYPGWACLGVGQMLRDNLARWKEDPETYTALPSEKVAMIQNLMRKGELIPQDLVLELVRKKLEELKTREGVVLVGFPRDIIQAQNFEEKFHQIPPLLLIDCSELELGRNLGRRENRLDDNVAAARRRLAIYREVTLPMLKAFDEKNRLKIIDGDADWEQVEREVKRAIYVETQNLARRTHRSATHTPTPSMREGSTQPASPCLDAVTHTTRGNPEEDTSRDQSNGHALVPPGPDPEIDDKSLSHDFSEVEVLATASKNLMKHEAV